MKVAALTAGPAPQAEDRVSLAESGIDRATKTDG